MQYLNLSVKSLDESYAYRKVANVAWDYSYVLWLPLTLTTPLPVDGVSKNEALTVNDVRNFVSHIALDAKLHIQNGN